MTVLGQSDRGGVGSSPSLQSKGATTTPLTRVSVLYIEQRINLWLRFGHPVREWRIDRWQRRALFAPNAIFCRVRYDSNEYGRIHSELIVLQAGPPLDVMQRVLCVHPGARLLLRVQGKYPVQSVLEQMAAIEALGIDLAAVSPAYWRTLQNRVSARMSLPPYTAERHAAHLAIGGLR